ncbi:hypothetical protein G6F46_011226 [Rhizopus delemar]|uniref:T6SS Phospholipase effector Tle1-like catalytic domain-containing protein n=2 Tax=Rhizopus TaxID=4842 RepID=A0A9P7CN25_9FUNG|nr:hypothetical protein G6F55_010674 [Rhizopus delemar]KAG1535838.1 hypothetical protein G6F51_011313 [Rhizopus arrhizus]KAG1490108.1 hypothetical protein G6F54_010965 [Rhizopus delemar]KAG1501454.1 hypothetical protein G6F53_011077 [Rhizopus delemar]KAG1513285.1 hypothetical protein G6F52_010200 [Rhizopus delemar]
MDLTQTKVRRIIVCLDGTWETPSEKTNVYEFSQSLVNGDVYDSKGKLWEQIHTYYSGLGTGKYRMLGGVFGNEQDEIWLLGFSRGAYAVRSLAGMINNVGLLPKEKLSKTEEAYMLYRNRGKHHRPSGIDSIKFRKDNRCQMPYIYFLGCFDTVGTLGVPKLPWYLGGPIFYNLFNRFHSFHDTKLTPIVKHAYHALSIHDQRAWFRPTLMHFSDKQQLNSKFQILEQVWEYYLLSLIMVDDVKS